MENQRPNFHSLLFCGGLAKNDVYVQTHADICELPAVVPYEQEMVLVGAAILGACASKVYPSLEVIGTKHIIEYFLTILICFSALHKPWVEKVKFCIQRVAQLTSIEKNIECF